MGNNDNRLDILVILSIDKTVAVGQRKSSSDCGYCTPPPQTWSWIVDLKGHATRVKTSSKVTIMQRTSSAPSERQSRQACEKVKTTTLDRVRCSSVEMSSCTRREKSDREEMRGSCYDHQNDV